MFDANHATIATKDIKRRYSWQAVKKLDDKECGAVADERTRRDHRKERVFTKLRYRNSTSDSATSLVEDEQFEGALASPKLLAVLTLPRIKEKHEDYNKLNSEFSERIGKINANEATTSSSGDKSVERRNISREPW
ncbi:hypothetical protein RhiirA5_418132 [Rhizophagus irregularis]|uniref:Uncharacterized protein n=1 Tax=Rhizophagus irregularis TaxID=588596 RepID=A0A2I1F3Y6_9GLOM|nr:hypothetical protein RhiirA5_418132 [Rhizophagus irregularis]PKC61708.1 hypothetical protein RhiirA1_466158 [Rhizophagus irregularis]PKY29083.1 hypothetical protein RhiirB3_445569 [Rhizophagus irregularis]